MRSATSARRPLFRRMIGVLVALALAFAGLVSTPLAASATDCDLSGTVTLNGADSTTIRVAISLVDPFASFPDQAVETDGTYCLTGLAAGNYNVSFYDQTGAYEQPAIVPQQQLPSADPLDVSFQLVPKVTIGGTVSFTTGSSTTIRAVLSIPDSSTSTTVAVINGTYAFPNLGEYLVYKLRFYDSEGIYGTVLYGNDADVVSMGQLNLDVLLSPVAIKVSGTIAGANAGSATTVTAYSSVDGVWTPAQSQDVSGDTYSILLPIGPTYRLRFTAYATVPQTYPLINSLKSVGDVGTALSDVSATTGDVNASLVAGSRLSGGLRFNGGGGQATVRLHEASAPYAVLTSVANDSKDGWSFTGVPAGTYLIEFDATDEKWIDQYYGGSATPAGAAVITVGSVDKRLSPDANLALVYPLTFSGTASVAAGATAPASYSFSLLEFNGSTYPYTWDQVATTTSTTGSYTLGSNLGGGDYRVKISAAGFAPFMSDEIFLNSDQPDPVDAVLQPVEARLITGTVDGPPATSTLSVEAYASTPGGYWFRVATAAVASDGSYSLPVYDGTFRVEFVDSSGAYQNEVYEDQPLHTGDTANAADLSTPVVVSGADIAGISATLALTPGISGIVTDSHGIPVAGVKVQPYHEYSDSDSAAWYTYGDPVTTDSNGRYRIADIAYSALFSLHFDTTNLATTGVSTYLNGLTSQPATDATVPTVDWTLGTAVTRDFTLVNGPAVTGRVLAGTVAVAGAAIQLYEWNDGDWVAAKKAATATDGSYLTALDRVGTYTASAVTSAGTLFLGGGPALPTTRTSSNTFTYSGAATSIADIVFAAAKTDDPPISGGGDEVIDGDNDPLTFTVGTVTITGTAKVGKTLKVKFTKWSPKPTYTYKWLVNGKPINKATKSSYKIAASIKGKKISVKVTAKKSGYLTVVKTSKSTGKVAKR